MRDSAMCGRLNGFVDGIWWTIVTEDKTAWAIDTFSSRKSADSDGDIAPIMRYAKLSIIPLLLNSFRNYLRLQCITISWRNARYIIRRVKVASEPLYFRIDPVAKVRIVMETIGLVSFPFKSHTIRTSEP